MEWMTGSANISAPGHPNGKLVSQGLWDLFPKPDGSDCHAYAES